MSSHRKNNMAYGKLVAKAWSDPAFKAKLLADPVGTLTAAGIPVAAGTTVKVVENTSTVTHLVLPPAPTAGQLSDANLEKVGDWMALGCGDCCTLQKTLDNH